MGKLPQVIHKPERNKQLWWEAARYKWGSWQKIILIGVTPPKINMEHNNGGLEDDFPFQIGDF